MKNRVPRKLKKIAKKRKAVADGIVGVRNVLTVAMGSVQLAMVAAQPLPMYGPSRIFPALKALRILEIAKDTAAAVQRNMSHIKDWRQHV